MPRYEKYGKRDLTYSAWHRQQADHLTYIDLDGLEYCQQCRAPLALIETARDVGQPFKATIVMRKLAEQARVPAALLFYTKADDDRLISSFRFRLVSPQWGDERQLTPAEYVAWLDELRYLHHCTESAHLEKGGTT